MNPFTTAMLAWQTSMVFTLRSMELWAEPTRAQAKLTEYAFEKQRAFAAGAVAASQAALAGHHPQAVVNAALRPAHRRVRANARKLLKP
jgi:hypothetical protein